jgi:hypothetical protein
MKRKAGIFLLIGVLLGGCTTPESSFQEAEEANEIRAYQRFIAKYPDHPLADQARTNVDDLQYQAALKTNTAAVFQNFVNDHRFSSHFQEAERKLAAAKETEFNNRLDRAITAHDYSQVVALAQLSKEQGNMKAARKAQLELDRFEVSTVGAKGQEISSMVLDQGRLDAAKSTVKVHCSVTSSLAESRSDLLGRNLVDQAANGKDAKRSEMPDMKESNKPLEGDDPVLYLFPETETDEVVFKEGALELRDRVAGMKIVRGPGFIETTITNAKSKQVGEIVATLRSLRRGRSEDRVFSINEAANQQGTVTYCAVVLGLHLPTSKRLGTLDGLGRVWVLDQKRHTSVVMDVSSIPMETLVSGSARLPADRWTPLQPGVFVRGGEILFEETRVLLGKGTRVARRRP